MSNYLLSSIEGRSFKKLVVLYLFGLMAIGSSAMVVALKLGEASAFRVTPLLLLTWIITQFIFSLIVRARAAEEERLNRQFLDLIAASRGFVEEPMVADDGPDSDLPTFWYLARRLGISLTLLWSIRKAHRSGSLYWWFLALYAATVVFAALLMWKAMAPLVILVNFALVAILFIAFRMRNVLSGHEKFALEQAD